MAKTRSILSADIIQALRNRANQPPASRPLIPWWMTAAIWALVALMLLSPMLGCAHTPKTATAFGFSAVQCTRRPVVCVPDKDMSKNWCESHVASAVKAINEAAGQTVLEFRGSTLPTEEAVKTAVAHGAIMVWSEALPPKILGVTVYSYDKPRGCMGVTLVRLSLELQPTKRWAAVAQTCVTHELLHAIGAAHAEVGAFPTIMAPAVGLPNYSAEITPNDRAALRAVYGN